MIENGVAAEEGELGMLLRVSVDAGRVDKVYEMFQRLRGNVRQVSEETTGLVEEWFRSDVAEGVGVRCWDVGKVKDAVVKGGGGWHGVGWLGEGKWEVTRTVMDEMGVCGSCGEKLVSVDINPLETENFASSLSTLACQRETRADFLQFQTRNLLRIAIFNISYIRCLFPEKYFSDKGVPALEMKIKKLMPMDAQSRRLVDLMEKDVYDALQKKYLKTLMFCICEKVEGPMIEEYACKILQPMVVAGGGWWRQAVDGGCLDCLSL